MIVWTRTTSGMFKCSNTSSVSSEFSKCRILSSVQLIGIRLIHPIHRSFQKLQHPVCQFTLSSQLHSLIKAARKIIRSKTIHRDCPWRRSLTILLHREPSFYFYEMFSYSKKVLDSQIVSCQARQGQSITLFHNEPKFHQFCL